MIAVYVSPESMTVEQYHKVHERLTATGAPQAGRKHHSCFGEDGHLMVFDIWETEEQYQAFAAHLLPILQAEGITSSRPPDIMAVVAFDQ
jgi:hypothetical protein